MKEGCVLTVTGKPALSAAVTGAAVSLSATMILVPGFKARTAEAIPQATPPPPKGTIIHQEVVQ